MFSTISLRDVIPSMEISAAPANSKTQVQVSTMTAVSLRLMGMLVNQRMAFLLIGIHNFGPLQQLRIDFQAFFLGGIGVDLKANFVAA